MPSINCHRSEEMTIPSDLKWMPKVVTKVERVVQEVGFDEEAGDFLAIAATEAVNNAILHGNKEDARKKVRIRFERGADRLTIYVSDKGGGFDPEATEDPTDPRNLSKRSGRGLFILKALMDEVEISCTSKGTTIKMTKYKRAEHRSQGGHICLSRSFHK
ncbi:MAG: ATP-binding protein [bacterium]